MRVSVFGIGYVGAVSAGCLAKDGNTVIAVDPNEAKVATLNAGRSPIVEPGLEEIIAAEVAAGRLRAISDPTAAIAGTDISFVCVGTPSRFNGSLDTGYVLRAAEEIGARADDEKRRTTSSSSARPSCPAPWRARSSRRSPVPRARRRGVDFGVAYYPEFLRESTAIQRLLRSRARSSSARSTATRYRSTG